MWPVEESTNLDELLFPWEFPFLDLRSEGLSNLVTLSEPRFARSDNRSTLLDIIPSSLRSRKVKILPRKVKFILVCIPLQAAFCLQDGIYILPFWSLFGRRWAMILQPLGIGFRPIEA